MIGQAFSLDGSGDYVTIPDNANLRLGTGQTVAAWINPSSDIGDWACLVGKGANIPRNYGIWRNLDGYLLFQIYGLNASTFCNAWDTSQSDTIAHLNTWTHVAGTYDGSRIKLYVNGDLKVDGPCSITPAQSSDSLIIGFHSTHTYFAGRIDEPEVFNRALSACEVAVNALQPCIPPNQAPECNNVAFIMNEDTVVQRAPLCSDPDSGDTIDIEIVELNLASVSPATVSGTEVWDVSLPLNFNGTGAYYTYRATDSHGLQSNIGTATISVTPVNDPPVCNDDPFTMDEDTVEQRTPPCSDPDTNDNIDIQIVVLNLASVSPATVSAGNAWDVSLPLNFNSSGAFYTYKANDGSVDSNIATAPITVTPVNDPPVAIAVIPLILVSADASCVASASIDAGSFDPDGDPITLTQLPPGPYPLGDSLVLLTVEDDQGVTDSATGVVRVVDDTQPSITAPGNITRDSNTVEGFTGSIGAATAADN